MMNMTNTTATAIRPTEKVAVRNLTIGSVLAMTGEKVLAVQGLTGFGRNKYVVTHRRLTLEKADGTLRAAEWNAGTNVLVYV